jgi:hypothetical protein
MTTSLYGTVTTQNTSSTNSTSLYGGAATPIPDSSGNLVVRGDLIVLSGNILTTAETGNIFPANATTVNLGLAATAVNIGAGSGTTTINNDLDVLGNVTFQNASFVNITADTADVGNITIAVVDDNTISTTTGDLKLTSATGDINLSQGLVFTYSENNDRLNRPSIQSTTGNTSGLRIKAPNATTSAISQVSAFSTNDDSNGKFISFQGRNSASNALRIQTGEYVGGVQQAVGEPVTFVDFNTVYATVNPSGPTVGTDLTTKTYVDGQISGFTTNQLVNGAFTFTLDSSGNVTSQGDYNLAQGTQFLYNENNDRTNRPSVQSTSGNTSGFRVVAPNATTSAVSNLTSFNTNDNNNGKFLSLQARGNATTPLRFVTGEYTAGVLGASGNSLVFVDGSSAAHASINPAGPSASTDLVTVAYLTAGSFVFSQVNIDNRVYLDSNQLVTSATTPLQTLDSFAIATYRSAKYQISVSSGSDVQVMEVSVMHNGTTAYQTVYADMFSAASLTDIAVTISGGNVLLQVTPVNAVTTYKISRQLIVI